LEQGFGRVLRAPFVPWLAVTATLARLPYGVDALAILLYVQDRTGSFATGGLVAAANALVVALTTPLLGRLVDRVGQTTVLVTTAFTHASGVVLLLALGESGAPAGALAACALICGLYPPLSPCLRQLWGEILGRDARLVRTALALDAILIEVVFVGGPLLAAAVFAIWSPAVALAVVTVLATGGALAFAAAPPSRTWEPTGPVGAGVLGPLVSPGLRTLLCMALSVGFVFGTIDVAVPAYGVEHGSRSIGAAALACFAAGSAVGGVLYGMRAPANVQRSFLLLAAGLPFAVLLMTVAGPVWSLFALAPVCGALVAPLTAAENELTEVVSPEGTVTEAYSWVITATVGGAAAGTALAGSLVESHSWREAVFVGAAVTAVGSVLALSRRRTLWPPARS
jgi:MFS family permease